ncbi:MAG: polysaccharide deacetylase family protein [Acidobacteriota bacterium]|nr:MAG: polysaccharide deacetylase family protein [Acidobacteriota bacterium]
MNFHRVSPDRNPFWPPLDPGIFDELIGFVKENFEIRTLKELSRASSSSKPFAVISFDDGYKDFIEYACPIMDSHGVTANLNVVGKCAEKGEPLWNIELYDYFASASPAELREIRVPGCMVRLDGDSARDKVKFGVELSRFLKNRPREERVALMEPLSEKMSQCEFRRTAMMNAEEVCEAASVHEIGSHSYSHESMEYESDRFFGGDLRKCIEFFGSKLEIPLETYAFPNGSYRESQLAILKENGVKTALLVEEKTCKIGDPALTRFTMYGESIEHAAMRVLGF